MTSGLPDIGVEPLTLPPPREWEDTLARIKGPMVLQQNGVPYGTALVWRTDLLDMHHRLIRMTALAEIRAEEAESLTKQLAEGHAREAALREALGVGERFLDSCFSAWSCGEPEHRVRTMLDRADQFRQALNRSAPDA